MLVCVSEDRALRRWSAMPGGWRTACTRPWTALYVETGGAAASERGRARPRRRSPAPGRTRWAAKRSPCPAAIGVADDIIDYAHEPTTSPISSSASPARSRWFEILRGPSVHRSSARAGDISVHVIADEPNAAPARPRRSAPEADVPASLDPRSPMSAAWLRSASRSAVGLVLQRLIGISNVALVFLTAVLVSAIAFGLWPSLFAVPASACWPTISSSCRRSTPSRSPIPRTWSRCSSSRWSRSIASNLAARVRAQAVAARERAKATEDLYFFSRKLAGAGTLDDLLWATAYQIALMLKVRVVLLLPEGDGDRGARGLSAGGHARRRRSRRREMGLGEQSRRPGAARIRCPAPSGCSCRCAPAAAPSASSASTATGRARCSRPTSGGCSMRCPTRRRSRSSASIWSRTWTARALAAETERLRSALLTSISHDLRTPLASILGSATSLKRLSRAMLDDGDAGRTHRAPSRTNPSGSTASSPICST